MLYIHTCDPKAENSVLATARTEKEAFKIAKEKLNPASTYDTYVTDTSRGYAKIIGFGSTGFIEDEPDQTDPCTRGGSCMTGREFD